MIGSANTGRREAAWLLTFLSIISFSSGQEVIKVDWGFDIPELLNATVGDTVQFVWKSSGFYDIWIHPSGNCDNTTGAIAIYPQPTTGGKVEYTFLPSDGSLDGKDVFFASQVGAGIQCRNNVNQPFKVYSRNDTAVPSIPTQPTSPTLSPTTTATTKTPTTKPTVAPSPKPTTALPTMTPTLAPEATVLPTEAPVAEASTPPPTSSANATAVPSVSLTNEPTSGPTEIALNSTTSSPSNPASAASLAPSISPMDAGTLAPGVGSPEPSSADPGQTPAGSKGNQDDDGDGLSTAGAIIGISCGAFAAFLFCCLYNIADQQRRGNSQKEQETLGEKQEENSDVPQAPATSGGDLAVVADEAEYQA